MTKIVKQSSTKLRNIHVKQKILVINKIKQDKISLKPSLVLWKTLRCHELFCWSSKFAQLCPFSMARMKVIEFSQYWTVFMIHFNNIYLKSFSPLQNLSKITWFCESLLLRETNEIFRGKIIHFLTVVMYFVYFHY